jgi:hypothetical protein
MKINIISMGLKLGAEVFYKMDRVMTIFLVNFQGLGVMG